VSPSQLPDETRISRVRLRTADLRKALSFYQGVLGLKVVEQHRHEAGLAASEAGPAIIVLEEDRSATPRPLRTTGLFHFAIRYPSRRDLAHGFQRLLKANYPIEGASDHDVSEAIYLSDPDNNGVELYADRPRKTWQWNEGEVSMSTKPLDTADLLSTIKTEKEPPRISSEADLGHIHLHVANLATAEHFFHDVLGFDVTQRNYPGALFFSAGGYHHHLAANTWAGQTPPPANGVGLIDYRFEVPSQDILGRLRARARELGVKTRPDVAKSASNVLAICDPNKNWLEFQCPASSPALRASRTRMHELSNN
jgi:catechol 2,3-dioxygenase